MRPGCAPTSAGAACAELGAEGEPIALDGERVTIPTAGLARRLGLDVVRFGAELRAPAVRAEVDRQRARCKNAGVRAGGIDPADQFQRVIDDERR